MARQFDAAAIMRDAWKRYRFSLYGRGPFDREAFARGLKMAWDLAKALAKKAEDAARRETEYQAELAAEEAAGIVAAELSAMDRELAALEYLPFGMNAARRAVEIRARYASQPAA